MDNDNNPRKPASRDATTHHKHDENKFDEEVRVDSGFGTLSISSEIIPEELANLIGANNLTAEDIEKAFNVAAHSTTDRHESSTQITTQIPLHQQKVKPVENKSPRSKPQHHQKAKSASTKKDSSPQRTKKSSEGPTPSLAQLIVDAYKQDDDGDTDLHLAIIHLQKQVTRIIVSLAKSTKWLEIKNKLFQTPLYLASLTNQPDTVRLLLQCGVRPELRNSKGYTPLHIAAKFGHVTCIDELLQGCDSSSFPEHRDYSGYTALHLAAKHDQVKAVRSLLYWGVDPNEEEDCSGYTALHIATMSGSSAVVRELLLNNSTDPNQPSFAGVMPLDVAKYYYYPTVIKMLEDAGAMESDKDINRWIGDDQSDSDQPRYEMYNDDNNYEKIILLS